MKNYIKDFYGNLKIDESNDNDVFLINAEEKYKIFDGFIKNKYFTIEMAKIKNGYDYGIEKIEYGIKKGLTSEDIPIEIRFKAFSKELSQLSTQCLVVLEGENCLKELKKK